MGHSEQSKDESNPFTEAAAGKYFVGRDEQIEQFKRHLTGLRQNQPSHLYVAGVHGTGKTSFLQKLSSIASHQEFISLMFNLDPDVPDRDHLSTIMRAILVGLESKSHVQRSQHQFLQDWDSGKNSKLFYHPRTDKLESNIIRQDFELMIKIMAEKQIKGTALVHES
ncbi:ATP-binding protein [Candidatus Acetothermia bacterium]|nr:ATP-binding protein [Candidatus Acetothermia bacterium]